MLVQQDNAREETSIKTKVSVEVAARNSDCYHRDRLRPGHPPIVGQRGSVVINITVNKALDHFLKFSDIQLQQSPNI